MRGASRAAGRSARTTRTNLATGDRRTSGTLASLAGLETAVEADDPAAVELAIRRILLAHAVIMGWDGVPLIYMGDEIGLLNDHAYVGEPEHANDSRWLHRPRMDWAAAARRHDPATIEGRIFDGLRAIAAARRASPELHAAIPVEIVDVCDPRVFAFRRQGPTGTLLALHNVSAADLQVDSTVVRDRVGPAVEDRLRPGRRDRPGEVLLTAYESAWLVPA